VKAEEVDGDLFVTEQVKRSGNSVIRMEVNHSRELDDIHAELRALGCDSEGDGTALAVHVPAEVPYAPVFHYLTKGHQAGRWSFDEAVLRHERKVQPAKSKLRPSRPSSGPRKAGRT
jgi:hypothetical protein